MEILKCQNHIYPGIIIDLLEGKLNQNLAFKLC